MDLFLRNSIRWLVAGLWLLAAGCGPADDSAGGEERASDLAPAVEAVQARRGTLPLEERVNGVVKADNQVAVRAEIEAPVVEVLVRNGEEVRRGQPLVRLDANTLRDQLRQAEASVGLAEAAAQGARARVAEVEALVSRTRRLAAQDLVSALELETQEAQLAAARAGAREAGARVEQARATVQERRTALGRAVIRAPVAGRIGQRDAEVGMLAGPGDVLFLLGDLSDLVVEVPLTEEMLAFIRVGQPVSISSPALGGEPLAATLSRISPFLEESSFSTTGEIDVENDRGRLRPGMFVAVDVNYGQSEQATLVPASALWEDPRTGVQGVYIVGAVNAGAAPAAPELRELPEDTAAGTSELPRETRKVAFQPVEVLAEGRAAAGVRGVEPGQWVVIVGQHLLSQGGGEEARVRVTTWERVLALQGLQREDLLQRFLDRQQEYARTRGAEPPPTDEARGAAARPLAGG